MKLVRCGCGGKAEAYEIHFWGKCYVCECTECGLTTKPKDTEAEAIEAWNTAMGQRTAKVERVSYGETLTYDFDGQCKCGKWVDALWQYCPSCGARLEWE